MPRKTSIIPKAPFARILVDEGAHRVSVEARDALAEFVTEKALAISRMASEIAEHSKRRTVNEGDVRLAAK